MSHSYVRNLMHCTFSTKGRYPFIDGETGVTALALHWRYCQRKPNEGPRDWRHNGSSSCFAIAAQCASRYKKFEWQEGYGAFSVSASQASRTIKYIQDQKEHHRKRTFEEEFLDLLDKHEVEYDSRYVFR